MAIEISLLVALVGCFVGLGGWLAGRDKKVIGDAQWRGRIDAKLDAVVGMGASIERLEAKVDTMMERLTVTEQSSKQAHKRLDEHLNGKG